MLKYFILFFSLITNSQELIIGSEKISPGIVFIFEGAIKDEILPLSSNLNANETNVHIEARVNWDISNVPDGTPPGGFIPYLKIHSKIKNQRTGLKIFVDLKPHINLVDNFHYARNISLPGLTNDLYEVEFYIIPPSSHELSFHKDWFNKYGAILINDYSYKYRNVNFLEIAKAARK